jgi:hypothetical protein
MEFLVGKRIAAWYEGTKTAGNFAWAGKHTRTIGPGDLPGKTKGAIYDSYKLSNLPIGQSSEG